MAKSHLVANCPRCGTNKITFDVGEPNFLHGGHAGWTGVYEVPAVCRHCQRVTVWQLQLTQYEWSKTPFADKLWTIGVDLTPGFKNLGYVSLKDASGMPPPDHVPEEVRAVFEEAATCRAVGCPNASAAMSRLCLDLVTKQMLPAEGDASIPQPTAAQRKRLFDRLDYLFANAALPADLKELADAIRLHGNDGAHDGVCTEADAADLLDFAHNVLERVYTVPERVRLAKERAADRRK